MSPKPIKCSLASLAYFFRAEGGVAGLNVQGLKSFWTFQQERGGYPGEQELSAFLFLPEARVDSAESGACLFGAGHDGWRWQWEGKGKGKFFGCSQLPSLQLPGTEGVN